MERTSLVYNKNGTLHVITADPPSSMVFAVIIVICFLLGVTYNLIVTAAILSNKKLKRSSFHVVLVLICTICLLDCLTNESLAFGFVLGTQTAFSRASAIVFQFFLFLHSAALSLLCLERTCTLHEHPVTVKVCLAGVLSVWILGVLFTSPSFGAVDSHYFPNRNAFGAVGKYMLFPLLTAFAFLLTWGTKTVCFVICVFSVQKYLDGQKQITLLSIISRSNEESRTTVPLVNNSKNRISLMIVFIQILLLLPLTISLILNLFQDPTFEPDPWVDPRTSNDATRLIVTNDLEPLFVFCRYIYNVVVPIFILSSDADVRLQSRSVFCCKRNVISVTGSVVDSSQYPPETQTQASVHTPVLFVTSQGLFLRVTRRSNPAESERLLISEVRFCDLTDSFAGDRTSATKGDGNGAVTAREIDDQTGEYGEYDPEHKKNVRFSSKVDAISPLPSADWNASRELGHSHTHVIETPLFVKGENNLS